MKKYNYFLLKYPILNLSRLRKMPSIIDEIIKSGYRQRNIICLWKIKEKNYTPDKPQSLFTVEET